MGNNARRLLAVLASAAVASGALAALSSPAGAAVTTKSPGTWATIDRSQPETATLYGEGDTDLGTWRDEQGGRHTTRAYFTFDLGTLTATGVTSAELTLRETSVASCRVRPTFELSRTDDVDVSTGWQSPPVERQQVGAATSVTGECRSAAHTYDVAEAVRGALAAGRSTVTLSVRLPATAEQDPRRHVRITSDPQLTVDGDELQEPIIDGAASGLDVPHQITLRPGSPGVVRWTWKLYNTDGEEEPEVHVVPAAADGTAAITVTLTRPGLYLFSAISHFANGQSLSTSTYFQATSVPKAESSIYLNATAPAGGVGVPDTFTFHPNTPDAVAYRVQFNSEPEQRVEAIDGVGTVTWAPTTAGENVLQVITVNSLGKESEPGRYYFDVATD